MDQQEVKELAKETAHAVTADIKQEIIDRLNKSIIEMRDAFFEQNQRHIRDTAEISTRLVSTTESLSQCVSKLELLHTRIFTGNGQPAITNDVSGLKTKLKSLEQRVISLEQFRTWAYTSGAVATITIVLGLASWALIKLTGT